jgi:hypothetical protein
MLVGQLIHKACSRQVAYDHLGTGDGKVASCGYCNKLLSAFEVERVSIPTRRQATVLVTVNALAVVLFVVGLVILHVLHV